MPTIMITSTAVLSTGIVIRIIVKMTRHSLIVKAAAVVPVISLTRMVVRITILAIIGIAGALVRVVFRIIVHFFRLLISMLISVLLSAAVPATTITPITPVAILPTTTSIAVIVPVVVVPVVVVPVVVVPVVVVTIMIVAVSNVIVPRIIIIAVIVIAAITKSVAINISANVGLVSNIVVSDAVAVPDTASAVLPANTLVVRPIKF
jgi:hypothetical protein